MLTASDWIERAESAAAPEEYLEQAERAARWPDETLEVAVAWLELGQGERARRCIDAAVDAAVPDHWPCRRAAQLLATRLGDVVAAKEILGRVESGLRTPDPDERVATYQWVMLAAAYRELFADEEAVARCLASAREGAAEPDDLCDLAAAEHEMLQDHPAARALLERAEAVIRERAEYRSMWGVANAWRRIGDDPAARAALTAGSEQSEDAEDLAALAAAWRSLYADEESVRSVLARAESRAATPADWLTLAEAYYDGGPDGGAVARDAGSVRRCLESAAVADPAGLSVDDRARIADGFRHWLADAERAAELEPARLTSEREVAPTRRLDGWTADEPRALLHRLRDAIPEATLANIAAADYGNARVKHLRPLVDIARTGLLPVPLTWYPLEVLELTRWRQGENIDHLERAFACCALALDAAIPGTRQAGHVSDVLAPLVESAWRLELFAELESLLAWMGEVMALEQDCVWPLFALLLSGARRDPRDPRLAALAAQVVTIEAEAEREGEDPRWLFRTTSFGQYRDLWCALAADVLERDPLPAIAEVVRRVLR